MMSSWGVILFIYISSFANADDRNKVRCEYPDDCPPAINQLQYKNKRCSAFLVARDLIATNLHCLPDSMTKERQSCEGIRFVFPKSKNHEPEILNCKTIEFLSEPLIANSANVDLAILRTHTTSNREPLNFSQEGFQDEKPYMIYKVDPSDDGGGVIVKTNCQAIQNSIINPYFSSDKSPIVNFIPCQVIPGNSGSPILSANNEVRGIIHSSSDGKFMQIFEDQSKKVDAKIHSAFATSFACVHLDLFSYPRYNHAACHVKISKEASKQLEKEKNEELSEKINKKVKEEYNKFTEKLKTLKNDKMYLIQWKFGPWDSKMESKNHFVYSPMCYNADAYKKLPANEMNLDLLEIEMTNKIDDRLRFHFNLNSKIHKNKIFLEQKKPGNQIKIDLNYSFGLKQIHITPCSQN